jgi:4-hydroxy-tetrahydrodipicolinate synthase
MFRGSYTVMATPFTATGALDEVALRRVVNWQIAEGVHGLIPLGSTGEFLSLTHEERNRVGAIVAEEARGRVPVLVGTAAESTDDAIALSRAAEASGADGLMVIPPFYCSPTEDEIFNHYRRIGEAVSIPIMVYNNPFTANVDLSPELIVRLTQIDTVRYVKESSGHVARVTRINDLAQGGITVFAGFDPWESIRAGAQGLVSVFGNIAPRLSADLFEKTADIPEIEPGRAINSQIAPLLRALAGDLYVGATKAAMGMVGQSVGDPRPPRLPLPDFKRKEMHAVLVQMGLLDQSGS